MSYAFLAILFVYLFATSFYLLRLVFGSPKLAAIGLRVTLVGALLQMAVLGIHFVLATRPFVPTYLDYFQISALLLAIVFVALCFARRFYGSGPFFITLITVFCILSLTLKSPYSLLAAQRGAGYLSLHLVAIFLSLSVFSLALVTAIMFLMSEWQIKNKKFAGIVEGFPPLAVLDGVHYRALFIGFILFTLAILTGAGYAKMTTGHYVSGDSKQVLSLVNWIFFAILLNFRVKNGWQGHKGIVLSLIGFVGLVLLFFVGL